MNKNKEEASDNITMEQEELIKKLAERERSNFIRMCPSNQNPVLSILRFHLLTEYYMERCLHTLLPRGDKVIESSLTYIQKIAILESLDKIDDRVIQCLKNLNRVRNSCAHEYDKTITLADIELIGRPFGKIHTELRNEYMDNIPNYLRQVLYHLCREFSAKIIWFENHNKLADKSADDKKNSINL